MSESSQSSDLPVAILAVAVFGLFVFVFRECGVGGGHPIVVDSPIECRCSCPAGAASALSAAAPSAAAPSASTTPNPKKE